MFLVLMEISLSKGHQADQRIVSSTLITMITMSSIFMAYDGFSIEKKYLEESDSNTISDCQSLITHKIMLVMLLVLIKMTMSVVLMFLMTIDDDDKDLCNLVSGLHLPGQTDPDDGRTLKVIILRISVCPQCNGDGAKEWWDFISFFFRVVDKRIVSLW